MVARHGEDKVVLQLYRAFRGFEIDVVGSNFSDRAVEVGSNFAVLETIDNHGQNLLFPPGETRLRRGLRLKIGIEPELALALADLP